MKKSTLKIQGEFSRLSKIREFVASFGRKIGFSEVAVGEIEMAVDEWATNVIQHCYQKDPEITPENRVLEIDVQQIDNGIEIVIGDRCKSFNPTGVPLIDLRDHLAQRKTNGLGLFAMKKFMDEIEYTYFPGVGNRILFRKYLKRSKD